jgi:hypothetical protein
VVPDLQPLHREPYLAHRSRHEPTLALASQLAYINMLIYSGHHGRPTQGPAPRRETTR